ncbi:hypothetical protein [Flavobacterium sp. XGLA_31]|uniref:hypothetical protein n=1 Tax=Flavobacterium sp. XGLA_31 TaxID=3447666 RepID=UPI003F3B5CF0
MKRIVKKNMKEFRLDNEPKITSGFTMPDGYFDSFEKRLLTQLPKPKTKVISFLGRAKTWYFSAAAVLILLLSVPLYNNYKLNQEEIDAATLEDYIASRSSISEEDIVNLLDESDLEKIKLDLNLQDKDIEEVLESNNNIEQYILD